MNISYRQVIVRGLSAKTLTDRLDCGRIIHILFLLFFSLFLLFVISIYYTEFRFFVYLLNFKELPYTAISYYTVISYYYYTLLYCCLTLDYKCAGEFIVILILTNLTIKIIKL